jgi:hypothetical protein
MSCMRWLQEVFAMLVTVGVKKLTRKREPPR